jgi:hypothetical protein
MAEHVASAASAWSLLAAFSHFKPGGFACCACDWQFRRPDHSPKDWMRFKKGLWLSYASLQVPVRMEMLKQKHLISIHELLQGMSTW